jgi:hypothetical protein
MVVKQDGQSSHSYYYDSKTGPDIGWLNHSITGIKYVTGLKYVQLLNVFGFRCSDIGSLLYCYSFKTIDGDKQRKKKRKSTDEKVKVTKMEIDEEEPVDNPVPKEAEADKPASKRAKLGNEISLLDRLHGSDPISTLRDLDQIMQSDLVRKILILDQIQSSADIRTNPVIELPF